MTITTLLYLLLVQQLASPVLSQPPTSWDWRAKGVVPPITNQGSFESAAHLAVVESMESMVRIKTGRMVILSVQNLIDCAPDPPSVLGDFLYVLTNRGIDTEAAYPTTGVQGPCRYLPAGSGASFSTIYNVSNGDESVLTSLVYLYGPVAVEVDATSWENYASGIDSAPCGTIDHVALVVGYTPDYWIVQNSWGTSWGIDGYIYIARNQNNANCIASLGAVAV